MADNPDQHKLNEAEKTLYVRQGFRPNVHRSSFSRTKAESESTWKEMPKTRKPFPILRTLFVVSLIFFMGAVVVAAILFTSGTNLVSSDNIELNVEGPVALKGGEQMVLKVTLVNHNTVALESVDLQVNYPAGTRSASDISEELTRYRRHLGTIEPGQVFNETLRAVLFGQENSKQDIRIVVDYRTAGSNAIFEKEKIVSITLTSSPMGVSIDIPDTASVGQEIAAKITLTSNSTKTLDDMYLLVTPPAGFTIKSTLPQPKTGLLWSLGSIAPGTSRTFTIRGIVGGELNESSGFSATVGVLDKVGGRSISVPYGNAFAAFQIEKPSVQLSTALNGIIDSTVIADPGERIRADITWVNNLSVPVREGQLTAKLSGSMLDAARVSVTDGFFNSQNNTITWRAQDVPELASLEPGAEAHTNFTFTLQDRAYLQTRGITNPTLDVSETFTGQKAGDTSAVENVTSSFVQTIKVNSTVGLQTTMQYTGGPFSNTGPMPPKVGQETTYTIAWKISSLSSGLRNARVVAILPTYVKWRGVKSPDGEQITYNPLTGEVIWNAGDVAPRAGYGDPARSVFFQVAMTPSVTQKESSPDLLGDSKLTATDVFTFFQHQAQADAVNTSSFDTSGQQSGTVE